jgi:hypothetical protein
VQNAGLMNLIDWRLSRNTSCTLNTISRKQQRISDAHSSEEEMDDTHQDSQHHQCDESMEEEGNSDYDDVASELNEIEGAGEDDEKSNVIQVYQVQQARRRQGVRNRSRGVLPPPRLPIQAKEVRLSHDEEQSLLQEVIHYLWTTNSVTAHDFQVVKAYTLNHSDKYAKLQLVPDSTQRDRHKKMIRKLKEEIVVSVPTRLRQSKSLSFARVESSTPARQTRCARKNSSARKSSSKQVSSAAKPRGALKASASRALVGSFQDLLSAEGPKPAKVVSACLTLIQHMLANQRN